jgi:hypothetical protein
LLQGQTSPFPYRVDISFFYHFVNSINAVLPLADMFILNVEKRWLQVQTNFLTSYLNIILLGLKSVYRALVFSCFSGPPYAHSIGGEAAIDDSGLATPDTLQDVPVCDIHRTTGT